MATVSVGRTPIGLSLRGFKLAPSKRKQAPPRNGGIRKITFGLKGGTLQLKAVNIPGASSHEVRWAERKIDRLPLDNEWTKTSFSDTKEVPAHYRSETRHILCVSSPRVDRRRIHRLERLGDADVQIDFPAVDYADHAVL